MNIHNSFPVSFESISTDVDSRFQNVKIWLCHVGENLNKSFIDKTVMKDAMSSLANIPILGFTQINNLNETDFTGHEQRLVIDENGVSIEYLGRAYGVIPETNNAKFEMKLCSDGVEREFLTVEAVLWTKFQECIDIMDRDEVKNQSMELLPSSIEGNFKKDGLFYFSKFLFDGACILGNSVTPAMRGSVVEKFTATSSYSSHIDELFKEYNAIFSTQEGGKRVDEKLKLFSKYPTLKEDDVAELKSNLDSFSLEELEEKLIALSDQKPDNFSLTAQQIESEIRAALAKENYTDKWGYESRSYWYLDHDETRVYAEEAQNGNLSVGMIYSIDGDFVTIDFASKKRVKFVPQDMEGSEDVSVSFVSVEKSEQELTKLKETHDNELQELKEFKASHERAEKVQVIKQFGVLTDEEMQPVMDNIDTLSKEEIETRLFAIVGKKGINFSASDKPKDLIFALSNYQDQHSTDGPAWVKFVDEYKASKK